MHICTLYNSFLNSLTGRILKFLYFIYSQVILYEFSEVFLNNLFLILPLAQLWTNISKYITLMHIFLHLPKLHSIKEIRKNSNSFCSANVLTMPVAFLKVCSERTLAMILFSSSVISKF